MIKVEQQLKDAEKRRQDDNKLKEEKIAELEKDIETFVKNYA